jgi:23S rRNA (guanosine2251-2'-O)-methyltransferase
VSRLLFGLNPVREAVRAHGGRLESVLVEATDAPQLEALARFAHDRGAKVERVSRADLDRLARGGRHQGALAFAPELALLAIDDVELGPHSLVLALDEIEDPQNFGAIVRSAVAFGATCVLWPEHHSAPLSPAMVRASAGAVEYATLVRAPSLPTALETLRAAGVRVLGLDATAPRTLAEEDLRGPVALVVGAEGKGLRRGVKKVCDGLVKVPMAGPVASLNASVAAALALYEATRQRGTLPDAAPE